MSEEEINSFDELNINVKDVDELALGLEVCSKKSNMLLQELVKDFFDLQQENKQLKEVIEEVREYVNNHIHQETFTGYMDSYELKRLLQILDKVKEN